VGIEPPEPGFSVRLLPDATGTVVVRGEVDMATAPALEACLEEASSSGEGDVEVEMDNVSFLDASGLSVLITAHSRLQSNGHSLRLRNPAREVRKVLEICGFSAVLAVDAVDCHANSDRGEPGTLRSDDERSTRGP